MADRDPDTIKRDIDVARDQLAATVDTLAERANPQRIANDIKAAVVRFVKKPAVAVSLAGVGVLVVVVTFRRIRQRREVRVSGEERGTKRRTRSWAGWRRGRGDCRCKPSRVVAQLRRQLNPRRTHPR